MYFHVCKSFEFKKCALSVYSCSREHPAWQQLIRQKERGENFCFKAAAIQHDTSIVRTHIMSVGEPANKVVSRGKRGFSSLFLEIHNHKLNPWERQRDRMGKDKEWVREEKNAGERGSNRAGERRQEVGRKRWSIETQQRPQRLKRSKSGRQHARFPSPLSLHPSLPTVHCWMLSSIPAFFWGDILIWDAWHQQLWIFSRSHGLRQIICKAAAE